MALDAGSAQGQLSLDYQEFVDGFDQAANAASRAGNSINSSMASAGDQIEQAGNELDETAKKSEDAGKAAVSLEDKLGSLVATAGTMATLKAGVSTIMGSMGDWAEAEASADRLRVALEFRGLEGSFGAFNELASKLQTLTGASDDTVKQLAAESIAQGKSVQQTMDTLSAAAAYSAVTGDKLEVSFEQFNKTLSGTAGRLGQTIPALKEFTEEELQNGAAIDYINAEYGAFTGQVGKTKISLDLMNQTVGDASESFGSAMAPMVLLVTDAITGLASVVANAGTVMKTVLGVGATALMAVFTGLAIRTAIVAAAKWGLFGAQMAVNAAMAVGNPLLWVGIAAAVGVVAATGALIASKVRETNAVKKSSEATTENTNRMRTASEVVGKYAGQLDSYSTSQLKAARSELVAAQSRAKYAQEIVAIGKKITEIDSLIAEKNKESMELTAAEQYKNAMESVGKTLEDVITAEQRLLQEITSVEKIRGATEAEEVQRKNALIIMYRRLGELREESAKREREEYEASRGAYHAMMKDIFKIIDERKVKEQELREQIESLERFKTESNEDEKVRLLALADLYRDLGRVQEEIDGVSMWQEAQYAIDDYIESVKRGRVTILGLGKALVSATKSIYSQAQEIVSQYYTNESAEVELAYQKEHKALEDKFAAGLITEDEYNAQKEVIDGTYAEKRNALAEKQFESDKAFKRTDIIMNAASAIAGWWSSFSSLGIPGIALAAAMTTATTAMAAAQIDLVNKQKFVPSYAQGGTHTGGLAQVNEEGGEIFNLPDGTVIVPNDISRLIAEDAGRKEELNINVSFAGANISKDVNLDLLAEKVSKQIARKVRR